MIAGLYNDSSPQNPTTSYGGQYAANPSTPKKKLTLHIKSPKAQFVDTEKASEPDSEKAGLLKTIRWGLKPPVINMLRVVMGKVDSMQAQMGSVSKQMEVLRTKNKYLK